MQRDHEWPVRGVALANKRKTHCPSGHPYDERNTYRDPRGCRHCRRCVNAACRRYHARLAGRAT